MPSDDGLRLEDFHRVQHLGSQVIEPRKHQAIDIADGYPLGRPTPQHIELMPKGVGFCQTPAVLVALTRWVRLRLRAAPWWQWKTPRRRRAALIALRVSGALLNTAASGRGPWNIARSKALSVGLSNAYFKSLGLPSLVEAR
jgi:hypothetical protein